MMLVRTALLVTLGVCAIVFIIKWKGAANAAVSEVDRENSGRPSLLQLTVGFVTDFFDTLGIGSLATTTTAYKLMRAIPDEKIIGTIIIGHALPIVAQAFIFLAVVRVDSVLLVSLIIASVLGSWFGAGIASRLPRRKIQMTMGIGLVAAAIFMLFSQLGILPGGGEASSMDPAKLVFAAIVSFVIGVLLMMGIGNYAPSLVLFSVLGMDPRAAFPIMMSSGAMMAMTGGIRFLRAGRFDTRAALGLTLGGIPAVLIAGLVVRSLPLGVLRWLVIVIVAYTAAIMLNSARAESASPNTH